MCPALYYGALSASIYRQTAINSASVARQGVAILRTYVPVTARTIAICRLYERAITLIIALMAVVPILQSIVDCNRSP